MAPAKDCCLQDLGSVLRDLGGCTASCALPPAPTPPLRTSLKPLSSFISQGRLCVLSRNTRDSGTFEGCDAMEIRNCKRINEKKIVLLKRDNTTFVPSVLDQVFPETSGLVTRK